MTRGRFRTLLEERKTVVGELSTLSVIADAKLISRLQEMTGWKGDRLALAKKATAKLEPFQISCLRRPIQEALDRDYARLRAERNWIDHQLGRLADDLTPKRGKEWLHYDTIYGSSYHTQGFGANAYASGRANLVVLSLGGLGVELRVETVKKPPPSHRPFGYVHTNDYRIEAQVAEPLDLEILRRRTPMPLRSFVKLCWRKGLNPRVYQPFLPYDYEKRVGLDHFGRELNPKRFPRRP